VRNRRLSAALLAVVTLFAAGCLVGFELPASAADEGVPVTSIDFSKPEHRAIVVQPYPVQFQFEADKFGDTAIVFPGVQGQEAPLSWQRFVWLDLPEPVDTFTISLDQIGYPGKFQSLGVLFGIQDARNYYHIYLTHTDTTHVGRVTNRNNTVLCRPGIANQWTQNAEVYQTFVLTVSRDGNDLVIGAVGNGKPLPIDGCRIPAAGYKAGKIGIGGNSHQSHAFAYKNIVIKQQ